MLGFLIPDVLQIWFLDIAKATPFAWQRLTFVALCAAYIVVFAKGLRRALLELDGGLALAARRKGGTPGFSALAAGFVGIGQYWLLLGITVLFLASAVLFEGVRQEVLPVRSDSSLSMAARAAQSCLRPATRSGGDTFSGCFEN